MLASTSTAGCGVSLLVAMWVQGAPAAEVDLAPQPFTFGGHTVLVVPGPVAASRGSTVPPRSIVQSAERSPMPVAPANPPLVSNRSEGTATSVPSVVIQPASFQTSGLPAAPLPTPPAPAEPEPIGSPVLVPGRALLPTGPEESLVPASQPTSQPSSQPSSVDVEQNIPANRAGESDHTLVTPRGVAEGPCATSAGDGVGRVQLYQQVYDAIPFSRAEYDANPSYRHDATMEFLFGQLRPTVVHRSQTRVDVNLPAVYPGSHGWGWGWGERFGRARYTDPILPPVIRGW